MNKIAILNEKMVQKTEFLQQIGQIMRLNNTHFMRFTLDNCKSIKSSKTRDNYEIAVKQFYGIDRVEDLDIFTYRNTDRGNILDFVEREQEKGNSSKTIANRLNALSTLNKYIRTFNNNRFGARILELENPFENAKFYIPEEEAKNIREEDRYLNKDQVNKLLQAVEFTSTNKPLDNLMVLLGVGCGLRKSEYRDIEIENIYQSEENWFMDILGKGNKWRTVPLQNMIVDSIIEYLESTNRSLNSKGFLFIPTKNKTKDGKIGKETLSKRFAKLLKQCRLDGYSMHSMRHTSLTWMYQDGKDLKSIQKVAGHSNISTTSEVYVHNDKNKLINNNLDRLIK